MTLFYGFGGYGDGGYDGDAPLPDFGSFVDYYVNLLIIQYFNRPRARLHVGVLVQESVASEIVGQVRDAFDLETAVGKQLDILAKYRGASRTVFGIDLSHAYFSMPLYDDGTPEIYPGFPLYDDATVTWFFFTYDDAERPIYSMNDDELRRLIKFRAKTQSRFLSLKEIDDILFEFFEDKVTLTDNGDMTITYTHDIGDPDTLFNVVAGTNSLPRPAGVEAVVV